MLSHARWTCRTSTEALKSCNATDPGLDRKGSQPLELLTLSREESFGLLVQPPGVFRYVLFSGLGPGLPQRSMVFSQHGVSLSVGSSMNISFVSSAAGFSATWLPREAQVCEAHRTSTLHHLSSVWQKSSLTPGLASLGWPALEGVRPPQDVCPSFVHSRFNYMACCVWDGCRSITSWTSFRLDGIAWEA